MLNLFAEKPDNSLKIKEIKNWTRKVFELNDDCHIIVTELQCQEPDCPDLETVIAFWTTDQDREQYKIYKPIADVNLSDIHNLMLD
ncbi:MAG: hypothetical protein MUE85_02910 [Microscillaceae bacterium]|jgi:hypothetical protein|nr:hypothetical protein [Microscillaceae bacterium]